MNRWIIVFLAVLVFGSTWVWWSRPGGEVATSGPLTLSDLDPQSPVPSTVTDADPAVGAGVGRVAPDFALQALDGSTFRLSEQRGKPVVLNFWATWCGPCQNELPAIQKAAEHFGDDVVFAGVDQGEKSEVVQSFADKLGLTFTIPMDTDGTIGYNYGVQGLPTTFFIDRNGVVQSLWMGEMNSVTLAENIGRIQ
jgi:cytochrome c biogenesis protein CcmG, thiol:disulfide interchange protein DsbE